MHQVAKILIFLFVILVSACTSINGRCSYDSKTDFWSLKTYDWLPSAEEKFERSVNAESFESAVNAQLEKAGFALSSNDPDFLISTVNSSTYNEVVMSVYGKVEFPTGSARFQF